MNATEVVLRLYEMASHGRELLYLKQDDFSPLFENPETMTDLLLILAFFVAWCTMIWCVRDVRGVIKMIAFAASCALLLGLLLDYHSIVVSEEVNLRSMEKMCLVRREDERYCRELEERIKVGRYRKLMDAFGSNVQHIFRDWIWSWMSNVSVQILLATCVMSGLFFYFRYLETHSFTRNVSRALEMRRTKRRRRGSGSSSSSDGE